MRVLDKAVGVSTVRRARPSDPAVCGTICFHALAMVNAQYNYPPDFPSVEAATGPMSMLFSHPDPRRSPKLDHLCSDRVAHPRHRTLARKPQMGKALSSPAPLGRWVTLREHTRVISRECRSPGFYAVAAESDGREVGSNCLDERSAIAGVGPITVEGGCGNADESNVDRTLQRTGWRLLAVDTLLTI